MKRRPRKPKQCPTCKMVFPHNGMELHINGIYCWGETPILDEETKAIWTYWKNKKWGSIRDGRSFTLSGKEMVELFTDAGITAADIGQKAHQYQLGRYGDTGGYEMGNCRFITAKENGDERTTGGRPAKAIMADGVLYESICHASRASGIAKSTARYRVWSKHFTDWYAV